MGAGKELMREYDLAIRSFPALSEDLRLCKRAVGVALQDLERLPPAYILQVARQQPDGHPLFKEAQPITHPAEQDKNGDTPLIFEWVNKSEEFDACALILKDNSSIHAAVFAPDGSWFASGM